MQMTKAFFTFIIQEHVMKNVMRAFVLLLNASPFFVVVKNLDWPIFDYAHCDVGSSPNGPPLSDPNFFSNGPNQEPYLTFSDFLLCIVFSTD